MSIYIYRYQDDYGDLYIGQTERPLEQRIKEHDAMRYLSERRYLPLTKKILFIELEDNKNNEELLEDLEQSLIKKYKPPFNSYITPHRKVDFQHIPIWEEIIKQGDISPYKYIFPDGKIVQRWTSGLSNKLYLPKIPLV